MGVLKTSPSGMFTCPLQLNHFRPFTFILRSVSSPMKRSFLALLSLFTILSCVSPSCFHSWIGVFLFRKHAFATKSWYSSRFISASCASASVGYGMRARPPGFRSLFVRILTISFCEAAFCLSFLGGMFDSLLVLVSAKIWMIVSISV